MWKTLPLVDCWMSLELGHLTHWYYAHMMRLVYVYSFPSTKHQMFNQDHVLDEDGGVLQLSIKEGHHEKAICPP